MRRGTGRTRLQRSQREVYIYIYMYIPDRVYGHSFEIENFLDFSTVSGQNITSLSHHHLIIARFVIIDRGYHREC